MKPMTNELREKIRTYIKNKLDISDLIKDVDIKGENLSRAIIKDFDRINDDISGCDLSYCIIGEEGKITNLSGTIMRDCNFKHTKFLGKVWLRRVDARGSNFTGAYIPYVSYEYGDFRGCKFCSTIFTIGSREGLKARFDKKIFEDLSKGWIIE